MKPELRRCLSLGTVTLLTVGTILGAGIYALIGIVAELSGPAMWLPFVLGALHSIFIGLGYAELASMYPRAGAGYVYVERGFETLFPNRAKFLSFLIAWNIVFVTLPLGTGAIALSFGTYFATLFDVNPVLVAVVTLILSSAINWVGVKESGITAAMVTIAEIAGLVLVMFLGVAFGSVSPDYLALPPAGLPGMIQAFAMILFTYSGYEGIVSLAEETRNPKSTIPRALLLGISAVALIYIGVSLLITRLAPLEVISGSTTPMVDATSSILVGVAAPLFSLLGCFATYNTILSWLVTNSRMIYGMADEGALPSFLTKIDPKRHTPWAAALIVMLVTILFTLVGEIELLVYSNTIASLSLTSLGCLSLILLRVNAPGKERPFRVPLSIRNIPIPIIIALVTNIVILLLLPPLGWLPFLTMIVLGAFLYRIFSCGSSGVTRKT